MTRGPPIRGAGLDMSTECADGYAMSPNLNLWKIPVAVVFAAATIAGVAGCQTAEPTAATPTTLGTPILSTTTEPHPLPYGARTVTDLSSMSVAEYDQIQPGMRMQIAADIAGGLGSPQYMGRPLSEPQTYQWDGEHDGTATVTELGGKVMSKAHSADFD